MNQPTQEQIKEFWEWCGFKEEGNWWSINDELIPKWEFELDLNNLFKYAVPKLQDAAQVVSLVALEHKGYDCMVTALFADEPYVWIRRIEDPALALFWAIWEVIKQ